MSDLTSLNLFTMDQLVLQVCDILGINITKDNLLHPAKDLDTTKMIYFAILRECGLADKIESHSAWNCFRIDPDIPSDIENHPEVFQVCNLQFCRISPMVIFPPMRYGPKACIVIS